LLLSSGRKVVNRQPLGLRKVRNCESKASATAMVSIGKAGSAFGIPEVVHEIS